jgi:hypothetical protein
VAGAIELSQLDDRLKRAEIEEGIARAGLGKWIGQEARRPLAETLPERPPYCRGRHQGRIFWSIP